jgi:hypothetical protein
MSPMADGNEGTAPVEGQAPVIDAAPAAAASGTVTQPDEVTTLRSRNAGLDAKVTELSKAEKAAIARAEAAEARAIELANGKDNGDAELRAQLSAKDEELGKVRREAALARIEAKYPETFGVFGDTAASMTEDQLAASEARFAGVTETSTPTPAGINAPRVIAGAKAIEDMTAAELEKHLLTMPKSVMGLSD